MSIYECPYCNLTSNRKYNLNTHIIRKHPGSDISPNLLQVAIKILILRMVDIHVLIVILLLIGDTI